MVDEPQGDDNQDGGLFGALRSIISVHKGQARHVTIRKRIIDGMQVDGLHVASLIVAMVIASIGLNMDSPEVIVGAMLICPIMGTALSIAYSIASADRNLLKETIVILVSQVIVCLLTSTLYFSLSPLTQVTDALIENSTATIWDVMIAFAGGFAGALGMSRRHEQGTLISGVAVATSLMPPLCSAGYGIATSNPFLMVSALYEFLVNVMFIVFGAEIVFLALNVPMLYEDRDGDGIVNDGDRLLSIKEAKRLRRRLIAGTLVFAVPALIISMDVVHRAVDETGTVAEVVDTYGTTRMGAEIAAVCPNLVDYRVGKVDGYSSRNGELSQEVIATVVTTAPLSEHSQGIIEALIRAGVQDIADVTFEVDADAFIGPMSQGRTEPKTTGEGATDGEQDGKGDT